MPGIYSSLTKTLLTSQDCLSDPGECRTGRRVVDEPVFTALPLDALAAQEKTLEAWFGARHPSLPRLSVWQLPANVLPSLNYSRSGHASSENVYNTCFRQRSRSGDSTEKPAGVPAFRFSDGSRLGGDKQHDAHKLGFGASGGGATVDSGAIAAGEARTPAKDFGRPPHVLSDDTFERWRDFIHPKPDELAWQNLDVPYGFEDVERARLTVTVVGVEGDLVRIRLEGSSRTSKKGRWSVNGAEDHDNPKMQKRGVDVAIQGRATWDVQAQKFTTFELVAIGTRRGATQWNGRNDDLEGGPIGFAFRIASAGPTDRMAPYALTWGKYW